MDVRRDPIRALGAIIVRMLDLAAAHAPQIRLTFGQCDVQPGSRNTVPERVVLSVDLRHPEQRILDRVEAILNDTVADTSTAARVRGSVIKEWDAAPIDFAPMCIGSVQRAVERLGYRHQRMVSGAGHDSVYVSHVAPCSMIFVPCERGLSHNEMEGARPEDLAAGCNVLLHAMLDQAGLLQ
jgi:N-carbamoyl-L-amino-acid hydrolase